MARPLVSSASQRLEAQVLPLPEQQLTVRLVPADALPQDDRAVVDGFNGTAFAYGGNSMQVAGAMAEIVDELLSSGDGSPGLAQLLKPHYGKAANGRGEPSLLPLQELVRTSLVPDVRRARVVVRRDLGGPLPRDRGHRRRSALG